MVSALDPDRVVRFELWLGLWCRVERGTLRELSSEFYAGGVTLACTIIHSRRGTDILLVA